MDLAFWDRRMQFGQILAEEDMQDFDDALVDVVIDGGYGDNYASTVIDLTGYEPEVLREGKGSLDVL